MAYYSGACTSFQNLADILVEKCQAHGWTWRDGILSKGDLFVKLSVKEQIESNIRLQQQGITLTGGTGKTGATLINPSSRVRLGQTGIGYNVPPRFFPANYHLFIFANEVYLVMKFETDRFYHLAFGKSSLIKNTQANGLWLSANACYYRASSSRLPETIYIGKTYGGGSGTYSSSAFAPFWNRSGWSDDWSNATICHGIGGVLWSSGTSRAYASFEPLIDRLPTAHFSDSPLLPYNVYLERPENKMSLICQFANARFLRIDNHEPEQIITLGHERWMVFPFYRKDVAVRDGVDGSGRSFDHTGTFGWAIRYEGA